MITKPHYLILKVLLVTFIILVIWMLHPMIWQLFISSNQINANSKNIQVVAHRGANNIAPENTLSAIEKALDIGVNMIEIDVHLTKDNKLIVIHDESLDRTTNGSGNVSDFTLEELKLLDAGSWFNQEFTDEQLPTLAEVLKLINGKATCLIEIKWSGANPYPEIGQKVVEEIMYNNAIDWTIVQSFESSYLEIIHQYNPEIRLGKLLIGSWQFPIPFYFDHQFHWGAYNPPKYIEWVNYNYKRSTPLFIDHLHNKGVKVGVFTPNSEKDLKIQINMGVDAVITNEVDLALGLTRNN